MGGVEGLKARFAGIFESLKKIFGFFAAIGYAIASVFFALLPTIGAVIGFIINLVLGFVDIILTAVGGIIDIISSIFNAFKTGDWGKVWTTIQSVFSDIVGKIGGLLLPIWDAIVNFFKNTDWGKVWQGIKDGISNAFKGIGNFISGLFGGKKGAAGGPKVMASLALDDDPFTKAFKNIQKIIGGFLSPIRDTIVNFFKNIDWAKVWSSITTALSNVAKTIGNFLTPIWNSIVTFFNSIDWGKVWQGILTALGTVIGIIWSLMSFIPSILIGIFNTIDWGAVWNSIVTFFNSIDWGAIWNGITTALSSVVGTIGTFLTPIWDAIVGFFKNTDWGQVWQGIKDGIGGVFNKIVGFFAGLFGGAEAVDGAVGEGAVKGDYSGVQSVVNGAKVGAFFTTLFQEVPKIIIDLFGKFITWLTEPDGLVDKVLQAFTTVKTNVINTVHEMLYGENGIITKFTDAFNQIKKVIITSVIDGANGFIGAIESGVNSVIDAINSLIEGANKLLRDLHLPEMSTIAHVVLGRIPIPEFAKGGLVMNPTLGLLGEAGPELVIPLSSFFKNLNQGQQLQPQWIVNVNNPQVRDDRDIDRIVQRVSVAIGRRSNRLGRIGV
jgi:phage-related protein